MNDFSEESAALLLKAGCVTFSPEHPLTLTSGRKSPVYVDCRRLIALPTIRNALMDMAEELISKRIGFSNIDVIAGGETAGIPFAAFLAERLSLPMAYIRKKPKGFGKNARIEGLIEKNATVLLVEDLATDGGSKLSFITAIREAGAVCQHCFVIFQYGIFPEKMAELAKKDIYIHALTDWSFILPLAVKKGLITEKQAGTIKNFLENPDGGTSKNADS